MNDPKNDDVRGVAEAMAAEHPEMLQEFLPLTWQAEGSDGRRFEVARRRNGNAVFAFHLDGMSIGFEVPVEHNGDSPLGDLANFITPRQS